MHSIANLRDAAIIAGIAAALVFLIFDTLDTRRHRSRMPRPQKVWADNGWVHDAATGAPVRPATIEERVASWIARDTCGGSGFFTYTPVDGRLVTESDPAYARSATGYAGRAFFVHDADAGPMPDDEYAKAQIQITAYWDVTADAPDPDPVPAAP